jgi:hypothetical protein
LAIFFPRTRSLHNLKIFHCLRSDLIRNSSTQFGPPIHLQPVRLLCLLGITRPHSLFSSTYSILRPASTEIYHPMSSYTCNIVFYASPGTNQVLARDQAAANALDPLPLPSESTTSEGPASNPEDAGMAITPPRGQNSLTFSFIGMKVTLDVYIGSPPNKHTLLVDRSTWFS